MKSSFRNVLKLGCSQVQRRHTCIWNSSVKLNSSSSDLNLFFKDDLCTVHSPGNLDVIVPHVPFRSFPVTLENVFWTAARVQNEKWVISNKNTASARGKFNPKSQEFREDWAPEHVQQFDAGRRELGKENKLFPVFCNREVWQCLWHVTSQRPLLQLVLDFQCLKPRMQHQLQTVAN